MYLLGKNGHPGHYECVQINSKVNKTFIINLLTEKGQVTLEFNRGQSFLGMFKYEYLLAFSVTVWLTPTFLLFQE